MSGQESISLREDFLDSHDIDARIDYLRHICDAEEAIELSDLLLFRTEAEGYAPDWRHGVALINDDCFEEYAEQLTEDIGNIDDQSWPMNHIDWSAAANDLKQDHTEIEFNGESYYML